MIRLLPLLVLFLATALPGQDIHKARQEFSKAPRATDRAEQLAAIDVMVATHDVRGVEDFLDALQRIEKVIEVQLKQVEQTGEALKEAWKGVDRQAGSGRPVSVGTASSAEKKHIKIQQELAALSAELDKQERWRSDLLDGTARMIRELPNEPRAQVILGFETTIGKTQKHEERVRLVAILFRTATDEARNVLVGLLARSDSPDVRVAVADALGSQGDVLAIPALVRALQDNAWPVRVAGAQALGKLPSLDAVPALIDALGAAEGRMIDELIATLENLTGETRHENAVVWKAWWEQHEAELRKLLEDLATDNVIRIAGGLDGVGRQHLLAGALLVLGQMDLDPYRPPRETPRPAPPEGEQALAADLRRMRIDAVGQALGGVEKRIRQRVLPLFLLDPYAQSPDPERRVDYLEMLGFVSDPRAAAVLGRVAEARSLRLSGAAQNLPDEVLLRLRLTAARGLARQGSEEGIANLRRILDQSNVTEDLAIEAARALGSIRKKAAVEVLVTALNHELPKARDAAHEALVALTGVDKGAEYAPWRDWWRAAADEFEPPVIAGAGEPAADVEDRPGTTFFGIESRSKHVVYILDVSGSMQAPDAKQGEQTRIQAAVKELVQAIRSLPDDATFNIIFYNHDFQEWRKAMVVATKENKAAAAKWAEAIEAVGATNIFDPLERAFALAGRGTHDKEYYVTLDTIFFLSDGQPNRGRIVTPEEIIKQVARMNELKKVKIHTIGVGRDHDAAFMRSLAELTGGTYVAR